MQVRIQSDEFDRIMETMKSITMEDKNYIPSENDLLDYIEKHPERYYLYLLWYSEHKPAPKNEAEKKTLKRITKATNRTIVIVDDDGADGEDDGQ